MLFFTTMTRWLLILAGATSLLAADDPRLILAAKAQSEFEHVAASQVPDLKDALTCIQTQASLLPVAPAVDQSLVHYRKGYCTLAGALVSQNASEFNDAAVEFDKAIEAWPARIAKPEKNKPLEPVTSALYILSSVSHLKAGWDDPALDRARTQLTSAVDVPSCASNLMQHATCADFVKTGRQWLGWIALRRDSLDEAERDFSDSAGSGWLELVKARKDFQFRQYRESLSYYTQAINLARREDPSFLGRLVPRHNIPAEQTELGGAQVLAGDFSAAIVTLDAAIKSEPSNARALFLRARAKELAKQTDASIADYNLASRTAFANAKDLASGEAHLYRGIFLYRRKDFSHAEDEFASALNFDIAAGMKNDASAWRHLAAVSGGACAAGRQQLERSLPSVSPFFPKEEARAAMSNCTNTATNQAGEQ